MTGMPPYIAALGGGAPHGQEHPMGMAARPPAAPGVPPQPGGPPGLNPLAMLSMGQQQMGRAFGGNPYDANAVAAMITQGLDGAGAYGRTPGFNPAGAL